MEDLPTNIKDTAKLNTSNQECTVEKKKKYKRETESLVFTEKLQKAEEKINRANHLYAFISQINQKIVRVKDEATLFRNACTIALEFGHFEMAWIGIFDDTREKIILVEQCGLGKDEIRLLTDVSHQSKGPQDYVLHNGTYYICNDIERDPEMKKWMPFSKRDSIRSCMLLPIKKSGVIIGTFNLYSTELNFLGAEEIKLLVEVSGDISFALDLFEKDKQRAQVQAQIKASETLYHSLFDNMLEGFAYCKMIYEGDLAQDFIYLDVNKAFEKLTGLKNVTGKKATQQIPGIRKENPEIFETYGRVAMTGKPERFEVYLLPLKMWLDVSVYSTEKGYFTAVFDVITEKKQAEEKLANSEKHFRALIEHGADMKSLTDANGKVIYGSPSIKKALGFTPKEFLLKYPYDLIHPEDIKIYLENREKLLQTPGKSFDFQQRRKHKNGTWIWCEGTITNLLNEPGINALVTNFRDISERKTAEEMILFNKNNLSALINNTKDLMWSVDRDFKLITYNQPLHDIIKLSTGKMIAKETNILSCAFSKEQVNFYKKSYERAFGGESFTETEYINSPVESWSEISFYPIREGDKVIGSACYSRNITESKRAESKIKELNENLEQRVQERTFDLSEANKALEAFSYSVSHDLRAPARTIVGFAKIIMQEHGAVMSPAEKELFGYIEDSSKRMCTIIDDLLKLAKFGKEVLKLVPVDMTQLVRAIWTNIGRITPHHAILELAELPVVQADMSMMEQVVLNLLSNAIKYSSKNEAPAVSVRFEQTKGCFVFTFKDNGVGFDMKNYDRLFGAFQRLHGISEFEGTGVGLLLVKSIVEKHGGKVWGEGKVNKGATFHFSLPVLPHRAI